ncbi:Uncharacterized protein FWK35_00010756 [Aphis craccivora]|uniref:Uncharacterized protein n=1 Tax=Aphis craccivora TaxID=307492 RepID=A0A6G0Z0H6_APHCR|nr:Uncharacterized protein FWK35_00010756 [Aphis craccivora]
MRHARRTVVVIHFSFWLCRGYAPSGRHFWGFLLFHPALLGISSFSPGTLGISTLPPAGRKKDAFERFNRCRKPNFRCRRDKKFFSIIGWCTW